MKSLTLRDRLAEVAGRFKRIDAALFTSFNFHADLFEQNILPSLFGADADLRPQAREHLVHKGLARTPVDVLYDPSVHKPSGKNFRYVAQPVFLPGRFFHAKNIVLLGVDAREQTWLYVAAMSANLSLSGWGENCEGFSDTWVHAQNEQPARELRDFLDWIARRLPSASRRSGALHVLASAHKRLMQRRCRDDPEGGTMDSKRHQRLYFSPNHASLWAFVRAEYGQPEKVRAASPYWGEAGAIAQALPDCRFELTASLRSPSFTHTNLGRNTLAQLGLHAVPSEAVRIWNNESARFFHIKLYEITIDDEPHTGVGSCNFTEPGQFWLRPDRDRTAARETGNVESMLFDRGGVQWPAQVPLPFAGVEVHSSDDAPVPLVVFVALQYDWKTRRFHWHLIGAPSVHARLRLPGESEERQLGPGKTDGFAEGVLSSPRYLFRVGEQTFEGTVTELNLDLSEIDYGEPIGLTDILEAWRTRAPDPGPPRSPGVGGDEGMPAPADGEEGLDWFLFFRCVGDRERMLLALGDRDTDRLLDLLLTRSDSVMALARGFKGQSIAAQWIALGECHRLMKPYDRHPFLGARIKRQLARLRREREALRVPLARTLGETWAQRSRDADALPDIGERLLDWFKSDGALE